MVKNLAVIFDMDGVLLDTEPLWEQSMMEVAQSHGIQVSHTDLKFTTGLRIHEVTAYWADKFPWSGATTSYQVAEDILDHIIHNASIHGTVMPGIKDHLDYLKRQNIPIGVATSSPRRMMNSLFEHFGIIHYFDQSVCGDEVTVAKPHPEIYLNCAKGLGIASYDCIAVEDSINGMVSAKAARMKVIAVPEPNKYDLPAFGLADIKVANMTELPFEIWAEL